MAEVKKVSGIICPFCGEDDFDLIGLKIHLNVGWCDPFNNCPPDFTPQEKRNG